MKATLQCGPDRRPSYRYGIGGAALQGANRRSPRNHVRKIFTGLGAIHARPYVSYSHPDSDDQTMNAPMEMKAEDVLRVNLEVLKREHRDLDDAIHALEHSGRGDQLALRRLKKQKLGLKDRIARIEDMLLPDIIA